MEDNVKNSFYLGIAPILDVVSNRRVSDLKLSIISSAVVCLIKENSKCHEIIAYILGGVAKCEQFEIIPDCVLTLLLFLQTIQWTLRSIGKMFSP